MVDHSNMIDWSLIPEHCRPGLRTYFETGRRTGGFLEAVLSGNWEYAERAADNVNAHRLDDFQKFLELYAPPGSYGSPVAYVNWVKKGGLKGKASD